MRWKPPRFGGINERHGTSDVRPLGAADTEEEGAGYAGVHPLVRKRPARVICAFPVSPSLMNLSNHRGAMAFLCAVLLLAGPALRAGDVSREHARSSPEWLHDGVIYEIFERDFSPSGDFNGITARLDELKDLGVNILWLMPIHPVGEKLRKGTLGSPYAVRDYYAISPEYGTASDLKRLVAESHRRGLKVILDVVLDHTAWDCVLMAHPEFYKRDGNGKILPPVKEWTDVAGLNYENPDLRAYMIQMLKHWIDPA
jgi:hypothetical protein